MAAVARRMYTQYPAQTTTTSTTTSVTTTKPAEVVTVKPTVISTSQVSRPAGAVTAKPTVISTSQVSRPATKTTTYAPSTPAVTQVRTVAAAQDTPKVTYAGGDLFKNSAGRVEPPSDGKILGLAICSAVFFVCLPLLPLCVARNARKEALTYFATHNIVMGNAASNKSHRWVKYAYITMVTLVITDLLLVIAYLILMLKLIQAEFE